MATKKKGKSAAPGGGTVSGKKNVVGRVEPAGRRALEPAAAARAGMPRPGGRDEPIGTATASLDPTSDTVRMVRELAVIVERRGLTELIVATDEATFTLRRAGPAQTQASGATFVTPPVSAPPTSAPVPVVEPPRPSHSDVQVELKQNGEQHLVTSPFVGTFYRRPNPDADNYVEAGQRVEKGQVLCIVEAMKLMNEIEADVSGVIAAVLAQDASPVEYGQPLFKITPG